LKLTWVSARAGCWLLAVGCGLEDIVTDWADGDGVRWLLCFRRCVLLRCGVQEVGVDSGPWQPGGRRAASEVSECECECGAWSVDGPGEGGGRNSRAGKRE
jgi:hypothetical protein